MSLLLNKRMVVFYTDHFVNRFVTQYFAKSYNLLFDRNENFHKYKDIIYVSYGIKRGTDKNFKKSNDFIYIDHGYLESSERKFFENKNTKFLRFNGYFRLIRNDYYFNNHNLDESPDRFYKLNIDLKDLNKNGEYILLSEPSIDTKRFLNIENWTTETINEIKQYTDREILVHNKFSKMSLNDALSRAYAFVSCQSTAGFKAIFEGIPAFFTHKSMEKYGSIKDINKRTLNHNLIFAAANNQWKMNEFFTDEFKFFLDSLLKQ